MKSNTKSSITLPPDELAMVNELMKKLKAKSKVDVIRQGLKLLKQTTDREELTKEFRRAAEIGRVNSKLENVELEATLADGLPDDFPGDFPGEDFSQW